MKRIMLFISCAALLGAMSGCKDNTANEARKMIDEPFNQEREFLDDAIRHRSPDVQKVDIIGNTVVYTHIFDGIVDVKTYSYDGDVCVEAERVYTFPTQMSALKHYRKAVEQAELYDDIQLMKNVVRYDLKEGQHELETKGLTKEQLKEKFDKRISDAKADMKAHDAKFKADIKKDGKCIENDMKCCGKKDCKNKK